MTSVERVDPGDKAVFDEFYEMYVRAFNRDFDQPYTSTEVAVDMAPDEYNVSIGLTARDDRGVAVGGAWAELPQKDNRTFAYAEVCSSFRSVDAKAMAPRWSRRSRRSASTPADPC